MLGFEGELLAGRGDAAHDGAPFVSWLSVRIESTHHFNDKPPNLDSRSVHSRLRIQTGTGAGLMPKALQLLLCLLAS